MTYAASLVQANPSKPSVDPNVLAECIQACYDCAQACLACADACMAEEDLHELRQCIRLNQDCADVCMVTVRVISRQTGYDAHVTKSLLEACAATCKSCGDECEHHAKMHKHCGICAEACQRCEQACRELVGTIK